ncbi:MAG TPA: hypothetical protein VK668_05980 [Mucilaginibacter sp.]|nr:hypothetical protein [Mucilaginibacter sp.]
MMESPPITDEFEITWKEKQYPCKRINVDGSIFFVIGFTQRPLYLSKGIDVNRESFWVNIPHDTKLTHVVFELGKQIDQHYEK